MAKNRALFSFELAEVVCLGLCASYAVAAAKEDLWCRDDFEHYDITAVSWDLLKTLRKKGITYTSRTFSCPISFPLW